MAPVVKPPFPKGCRWTTESSLVSWAKPLVCFESRVRRSITSACGRFLDEEKRDGKVYHVKDDSFADHQVLNDPETVLDHYLAHYVTTQSPGGFDFRA